MKALAPDLGERYQRAGGAARRPIDGRRHRPHGDRARRHPQAPQGPRGAQEGLLLELQQAAARALVGLSLLRREPVASRRCLRSRPSSPNLASFSDFPRIAVDSAKARGLDSRAILAARSPPEAGAVSKAALLPLWPPLTCGVRRLESSAWLLPQVRQHLDERQARPLGRRPHPHRIARHPLRLGSLRGHPLLLDHRGPGGLPPGRPHASGCTTRPRSTGWTRPYRPSRSTRPCWRPSRPTTSRPATSGRSSTAATASWASTPSPARSTSPSWSGTGASTSAPRPWSRASTSASAPGRGWRPTPCRPWPRAPATT